MGVDLLDEHERLSFDSRKGSKARSTRATRATKDSRFNEPTLFDLPDAPSPRSVSRVSERLLHYRSPRKRSETAADKVPDTGDLYRIRTKREGGECSIEVARRSESGFVTSPTLRYVVRFQFPIGDGLERIECVLLSDSDEGLAVAWDAIEDVLGDSSGYKSMLDVYGHFTEPHPVFSLDLELLTEQLSFPLRFAKHFSAFSATRHVLPARELQKLYEADGAEDFELTRAVRTLRELRFDVRVNETNSTIPPGHFRCCYPSTININRQVSVSWREPSKV